jgi:hypothetical protein
MKKYLMIVFVLSLASCKKENSPTSPINNPNVIIYSGKTYHSIILGNQTWLKENLDVGDIILSNQDQTNNRKIEKYCYNDSSINCDKYGGLYQWDEAMQYDTTENIQGICPTGWHIPSKTQLQTLMNFINDNEIVLSDTNKLFILFSGYRDSYGNFFFKDKETHIWSSTKNMNLDVANSLNLYPNNYISSYNDFKKNGFNIRCIKD